MNNYEVILGSSEANWGFILKRGSIPSYQELNTFHLNTNMNYEYSRGWVTETRVENGNTTKFK